MRKSSRALALSLLCLAAGAVSAGGQQQEQERGRRAFDQCIACHSLKAGENGVGPTLFGVLGSTAGALEGFRFSGPMKRSGIVWDETNLAAFLRNPQEVVPNTRMPYSGMTDEADLKALVAYLVSATR
jgi:cytochrome c